MRPAYKGLTLLISTWLIAAVAAADTVTEDFLQSYPLSAGGSLSLDNINGDVIIEAWNRDEVEISAVKRASSQEDLDDLQIEVDASADRLRIETRFRRQGRERTKERRSGSVDYTLHVPRTARLADIDLVNGDLTIHAISGDIEASLVNGNIEAADLSGDVELSTVNGTLSASFAHLAAGQEVDLSSVNGSLEVQVPRDGSADIEASTVHGRIRSELGFEVKKGEYVGSSMRGKLGSGGASVELDNVNGSITVRPHS